MLLPPEAAPLLAMLAAGLVAPHCSPPPHPLRRRASHDRAAHRRRRPAHAPAPRPGARHRLPPRAVEGRVWPLTLGYALPRLVVARQPAGDPVRPRVRAGPSRRGRPRGPARRADGGLVRRGLNDRSASSARRRTGSSLAAAWSSCGGRAYRTGTHRDEYLDATDPALSPAEVVGHYCGRWSVETTFEKKRAHWAL